MKSSDSSQSFFGKRISVEQIEEGLEFTPKFDDQGLIPVITTDYQSGEVLMHAYMNRQALRCSIDTGEAVYWSRSRQMLWHKGKTSGFVQRIVELRIDDDQDAVWLRVDLEGGASCHVGYRSCFYRTVPSGAGVSGDSPLTLEFTEHEKVFDPEVVYPGVENPTKL